MRVRPDCECQVNAQLNVGIHVNAFPIPSEAFVIEQARTLTSFHPVFLVRQQLREDVSLDCRPIQLGNRGKLKKRVFALFPGAWAWGGMQSIGRLSLMHAHFGPNGVYALPIARELRVPLVVTFHGFDATVSRYSLLTKSGLFGIRYLAGMGRLQREGARFIAVSKFLQERLIGLGFPPDRIRQHYIGVDPQRFTPLPAAERSLDIVCVGRLMEAKGIGDLIQAFSRIARAFPESRLRLIGDGPDRQKFVSLAADCKLSDRVRFEGVMPHTDVAELVRRCAVSVLVSKRGANAWEEAFGLASIEAAAAGLPVVVSTNGGLPETVLHGETGFVVTEGDINGIADALTRLLSDAAMREQMGRAGRARVLQDFNLPRQTQLLEDIYLEAIQK